MKMGKKMTSSNYRSVIIFSIFEKLIEKLLYHQLNEQI